MADRKKAPTTKPDSVHDRLVVQRDRLELLLAAETDGAKFAALSREYRLLLEAIDNAAPQQTGSKVDELAARRANWNTVTADPSRTAKHRKSAGG